MAWVPGVSVMTSLVSGVRNSDDSLIGEALGGAGASVSDTAEFLHNSGLPCADIPDEDNIMRLRHEVETQKIEWNENYNICSNLIEVICRTEIES